jgi:hypothetical protein
MGFLLVLSIWDLYNNHLNEVVGDPRNDLVCTYGNGQVDCLAHSLITLPSVRCAYESFGAAPAD